MHVADSRGRGPSKLRVDKPRTDGRGKPLPYDDEHYCEAGRRKPLPYGDEHYYEAGRRKPRTNGDEHYYEAGRGKPRPYDGERDPEIGPYSEDKQARLSLVDYRKFRVIYARRGRNP